ncbi:MAG TPA: UPF0182 family protein [Gemmatimonadaceae bacterium]|nr:UPF0182 family protein [Gemmatimonadaceae bacterium]
MPRRRLLAGVVIAAILLVGGRTISALYADHSWYGAMGAAPLWSERAGDMLLIYGIGWVVAVLVAFVNLSALGRSIGSLTLPRRLANVEFGEAVPRKYLDRVALVLSIAIAAALTPALPSWTSLALARLKVTFREADPYFQHDLAFYTTWLPFEKALYSWATLLIVSVSLLVVILYSLTPGLRWEKAGLRMSAYVRRHLSVLAALLLLITMWSYRLESYDLLIRGSGVDRVFSYVDHQWLLPGLLLLSIATAAAAITVLLSGWTGQLRTSFVAVTVIVLLSVTVQEIVPLIVHRFTPNPVELARERSYIATRAEYTRRAFALNGSSSAGPGGSAVSAALDSVATSATGQHLLRQDSLVYPGARGLVVVSDPQLDVAGPRLGDGLPRLAYAWAYQSLDLLSDSIPRRARLVAVRDVRNRVGNLAPIFVQGSVIEPMFHADTLYWKLELYSASSNYPLSQHFVLAGEERSYFRHAGTALVNARTGRVMIAADPTPDPISQAWTAAFTNFSDYRAPGIARELTTAPWEPVSPDSGLTIDSTFRAAVTRLYNRMRAALAAADLKAFGAAYDSLGALIAPHK